MSSSAYDSIIVGAGIGGLVCGCYLAKNGLRTLIVEQSRQPGGCCTSFERNGYRFDVGVHYLGSIRRGILGEILRDLNIGIKLNHTDPTEKIILPDRITYIRQRPRDTIREFKKTFAVESKNIDRFFKFILSDDFLTACNKIKSLTFKQVLDSFFEDYRLKSTLSLLIGNIGLSAATAAAIPSAVLFREYILDSGHYPEGGMQSFPYKLCEMFKKRDGELLLNNRVKKIIREGKAYKVVLDNKEEFTAKVIISDVDATLLFNKLISKETAEKKIVKKMETSPSMFLLYLGIKGNLEKIYSEKCNLWYFCTYDIERIYQEMSYNIPKKIECLACSFPSIHDQALENKNKGTMTLFMLAPYKDKGFWVKNKFLVGEMLIKKIEEIIPGLSKIIETRIHGTPFDLYSYTLNRNGAFVGWRSNLNQSKSSLLPQRTSLPGLYLVGHWCTMGYRGQGGIPNVAFSGKRAAYLILKNHFKSH